MSPPSAVDSEMQAGDPEGPLLRAENLGRRGRNGAWLFRHVALDVEPGDRWAVQGPSGCGKTQLFRSLAQLDPQDEGQLLLHGRPVSDSAIPQFRSRVLYLHQSARFLEGTVEDNLRWPYRLAVHRDRQWDQQRTVKWLAAFRRDASFLAKRVDELSGGEAQMVSLLRSLQLDPDVFLLDEPTAAMDNAISSAAERIVADWHSENPSRATLWITHRPEQARLMGTKLVRMERGELVYAGPMHDEKLSDFQVD